MISKMKKIDKLRLMLLGGAILSPLDIYERTGMLANTFNRLINVLRHRDGWSIHSKRSDSSYHIHWMEPAEIKRIKGEL